jgi:hypothetical protein
MKSITEYWVWRVFFGVLLGCVMFPYAWNCFKTGQMLDLPYSVVVMILGLAGVDGAGSLISLFKKP